MAYRKSRAKYETIVEMYTIAMVELKFLSHTDYLVNGYRTLNPKKMREFLPLMRANIDAMEKHGEMALIDSGPPAPHRNRPFLRGPVDKAVAQGYGMGCITQREIVNEEIGINQAAAEEGTVRRKVRAGVYHGRNDVQASWIRGRR